MKVVTGDLLALAQQGVFDVIVHGANCHCTMGAGIAAQIRRLFPAAYQADLNTAKGDRAKLGSISCATVSIDGRSLIVVNAYTQFDYHGPAPLVDYHAIGAAMLKVKRRFAGKRIGYPRIGAGLGGGDWARISAIIDETLADEDHTLVEYRSAM